MRALDLDSLLGDEHQYATFHDSELASFSIDFVTATAKLEFQIPCGFVPENQLSYQRGTLELGGLLFYLVEATAYRIDANDRPTLWITSDGPLPNSEVELDIQLPEDMPQDAFAHYFYSSTTNSFIVVAAMRAEFTWQKESANA